MSNKRRCLQGFALLVLLAAWCSNAADVGEAGVSVQEEAQTVQAPEKDEGPLAGGGGVDWEKAFDPNNLSPTVEYYLADTEIVVPQKSTYKYLFAAFWTAFLLLYLLRWKHEGENMQDTLVQHLNFDLSPRLRPLGKFEPDLGPALVAAFLSFLSTGLYKKYTDGRPRPYKPSLSNHPPRGIGSMVLGALLTAFGVLAIMEKVPTPEVLAGGLHGVLGLGAGFLVSGLAIFLYALFKRIQLKRRLARIPSRPFMENGDDSAPLVDTSALYKGETRL